MRLGIFISANLHIVPNFLISAMSLKSNGRLEILPGTYPLKFAFESILMVITIYIIGRILMTIATTFGTPILSG
jgi:hypothetical protein